jgi:hypothetical protein
MKQLALAVILAVGLGAVFVVSAAITANAGNNCQYQDDAPNTIP